MKQLHNALRKATLEDEEYIKRLLLIAFKDSSGLHLPLQSTEKNASNFYAIEIRPAIINEDPAYLMFDDKSNPIAFSCCSTCLNKVYDLDKKIAMGVITIIKKHVPLRYMIINQEVEGTDKLQTDFPKPDPDPDD